MPSTTRRAGVPVRRLSLFIRLFIALGLAMLAAPLLTSSASAVEDDPNQVVVCKYSHTPHTGEVAQTVIIVSTSALEGKAFGAPFRFKDEHDFSIAIRFAKVGENTGSVSLAECPGFPAVDECPDLPGPQPVGFQCAPLTETDTQDLTTVDCPTDTVTTLHQERTRTQTFVDGAWVFGEWSEWLTVDTTVVEATDQQCPPEVVEPPNPVNPPNPPNPPEVVNPPSPVNPPAPPEQVSAPTAPVLPQTGSAELLGALALMTGLAMVAGAGLVRRSRKLGVPTT